MEKRETDETIQEHPVQRGHQWLSALPNPEKGTTATLGQRSEAISDLLRSNQESILRGQKDRVEAMGIDSTVVLAEGTPFIEVIKEVQAHKHDIVVTSATSASTGNSWFPGSTQTHIIKKCPAPIWEFDRTRKRKFHQILVPADPTETEEAPARMHRTLLELGSSLAGVDSAQQL